MLDLLDFNIVQLCLFLNFVTFRTMLFSPFYVSDLIIIMTLILIFAIYNFHFH
jgi:hypothetical protein